MVKYRRRENSDAWHWCTNCSHWPTEKFVEIDVPEGQRPSSGELDDECRSKERAENCDK